MDYDRILTQLGEFGPWQRRLALLLWLPPLAQVSCDWWRARHSSPIGPGRQHHGGRLRRDAAQAVQVQERVRRGGGLHVRGMSKYFCSMK